MPHDAPPTGTVALSDEQLRSQGQVWAGLGTPILPVQRVIPGYRRVSWPV